MSVERCPCGNQATRFGVYENVEGFACDVCCGHGNEDGCCHPLVGWADELLAGVDLDDKSQWGPPIGEDVEGYLSEALAESDERHDNNMRRWLVSEMEFEEGEG